MPITPYGNAEAGGYTVLFTGAFEASYPKARRLIFGFAILRADRQTLEDGPDGCGLYAVAVCNRSDGTNPKSKPYKIRRAMLQPEEARDNQLVLSLPAAEHFTTPYEDRQRILEVRVTQREKDGRQVSLVTHIRRPRDGEWQCIEGEYEGAEAGTVNGRPFWLREDGTAIRYDQDVAHRLIQSGQWERGKEASEWIIWEQTTADHLQQWLNDDGTLRVLTDAEIAALEGFDPVRYRIAQRRTALGML
jgi:hypothetical protein